ncbi:MAG: hypothetical protein JNJ54_37075 [Myxococcaceae bacterium]|nr:hypothetical protein [Myxococcaceae bacterium]
MRAPALLLVVGVACGVAPSAKVSSLSGAQTRQWCRARLARFEARYSANERATLRCNVEGLVLPGLLAFSMGQPLSPAERVRMCEEHVAQCIGAASSCDTATTDPTCDATVRDVDACFDAQLEALAPLTSAPRCELAAGDGGVLVPPCPAVDSLCPGRGLLP